MAWLLYTWSMRGLSPRIIHDSDKAGNPVIGEAERGDGSVLARHRLRPGEETLAIAEPVKRYPPPRPPEQRAPVQPDPEPPAPTSGAAAKQLEAA